MNRDRDDADRQAGAMNVLGLHAIAAERGDGFVPGFLELLVRARQDAAPPRLVSVNDRLPQAGSETGRQRPHLEIVQTPDPAARDS